MGKKGRKSRAQREGKRRRTQRVDPSDVPDEDVPPEADPDVPDPEDIPVVLDAVEVQQISDLFVPLPHQVVPRSGPSLPLKRKLVDPGPGGKRRVPAAAAGSSASVATDEVRVKEKTGPAPSFVSAGGGNGPPNPVGPSPQFFQPPTPRSLSGEEGGPLFTAGPSSRSPVVFVGGGGGPLFTAGPSPSGGPAQSAVAGPPPPPGLPRFGIKPSHHQGINRRLCMVCGQAVPDKLRHHLAFHHLPWYFFPLAVCWPCSKAECKTSNVVRFHNHSLNLVFQDVHIARWLGLITGYLYELASAFDQSSLSNLLREVQNGSMYLRNYPETIPPSVTLIWQELDSYLGNPIPSQYSVSPPNSVAALTHHSVVNIMLGVLPANVQQRVLTSERLVSSDNQDSSVTRIMQELPFFELIDSHIHGLVIVHDTHMSTLSEFVAMSDTFRTSPRPFTIPYVICNVVFNSDRRMLPRMSQTDDMFYCVGFHPKERAEVDVAYLESMLIRPDVVGVGECGYDFSQYRTVPNDVLQHQLHNFTQQLRLAQRFDVTVVLHLRDANLVTSSELHRQAREQMLTVLSPSHRVHLHCFAGSTEDAKAWQEAFPNLKFGVTSLISRPELKGFLQVVDIRRVVIETDAPYLVPSTYRQSARNSPAFLDWTLGFLCRAFNMPPRVIARQLNQNCREVYGLT